MDVTNKPTIQELIDRTGMYDKELSEAANISEATLRNIKAGKQRVRRKMVYRLLNTINQKLSSNYDIADLNGINV